MRKNWRMSRTDPRVETGIKKPYKLSCQSPEINR